MIPSPNIPRYDEFGRPILQNNVVIPPTTISAEGNMTPVQQVPRYDQMGRPIQGGNVVPNNVPPGGIQAPEAPLQQSTQQQPTSLSSEVEGLVSKYSAIHKVDPTIIRNMIQRESGGNQQAVSRKGAIGTMQLMPGTAKEMGVDPNTVEGSVEGGVKYFAKLLAHYGGDVSKALAGYNAGPGRVDRGGPLPQETQKYVEALTPKKPEPRPFQMTQPRAMPTPEMAQPPVLSASNYTPSMPAPEMNQPPTLMAANNMPTPAPIIQNPPATPHIQAPPPVQFQMPEPSLTEQRYNAALDAYPRREDYHQSKFRGVMNTIAAGLAGAAAGPKAGLETAKALTNQPYQRAMEDWSTKVGSLEPQVKAEQHRFTEGTKLAEIGVKNNKQALEADEKNAGFEQTANAQKETASHNKATERYQNSMAVSARLRAEKKSTPEIELELSKTDPEGWKFLQNSKNHAKSSDQLLDEYEAKLKLDLRLKPQIAGAVTAAQEAAKGKAENENLEPLIEQAKGHVAKEMETPGMYGKWLMEIPVKTREKIMARVPLTNIVPEANRSKAEAATISLNHVTSLRDIIQDPYVRQNLGPWLGRIQSAEGRIGGHSKEKNPENIRKEQEFLNFMTKTMVWEAQVLGGTRPSWQLIQHLKGQGIKAAFLPEQFEGALDADSLSAQNTLLGLAGVRTESKFKPKVLFKEIKPMGTSKN